jgi:hypothetical protein
MLETCADKLCRDGFERKKKKEKGMGQGHKPAAAAASVGDFLASGVASFAMGLRSLPGSERRDGGDRERRSNRDVLLGSGSVWSKRERFTVRRSVSSILDELRILKRKLGDVGWNYATWEYSCYRKVPSCR